MGEHTSAWPGTQAILLPQFASGQRTQGHLSHAWEKQGGNHVSQQRPQQAGTP